MRIGKEILNFACFLAIAQTSAGISQRFVALDLLLICWGKRHNSCVEFRESSICEMRKVACLKMWEAVSLGDTVY